MYPSLGQNGTVSGESLMAKCFSIVYKGYPPHRSHPAVSAAGCVFVKATPHKCQNQICRRKHDIEFGLLLFKPSVWRLSDRKTQLPDNRPRNVRSCQHPIIAAIVLPLTSPLQNYLPADGHIPVVVAEYSLSTAVPEGLSFCFISYQFPQSRISTGFSGSLSVCFNRS